LMLNVSVSTSIYLSHPVEIALTRLHELGVSRAELFLDPPHARVDTLLEDGAWQLLRDTLVEYDMSVSVHGPSYDLHMCSPNPGIRNETKRQYAECIDLAAKIGARIVVFHAGTRYPGDPPGQEDSTSRARALATLRDLAPIAQERGVVIALENCPFAENSIVRTAEMLAGIISEVCLASKKCIVGDADEILDLRIRR
jgi:sugar phosphate isomerase/epimerase